MFASVSSGSRSSQWHPTFFSWLPLLSYRSLCSALLNLPRCAPTGFRQHLIGAHSSSRYVVSTSCCVFNFVACDWSNSSGRQHPTCSTAAKYYRRFASPIAQTGVGRLKSNQINRRLSCSVRVCMCVGNLQFNGRSHAA